MMDNGSLLRLSQLSVNHALQPHAQSNTLKVQLFESVFQSSKLTRCEQAIILHILPDVDQMCCQMYAS